MVATHMTAAELLSHIESFAAPVIITKNKSDKSRSNYRPVRNKSNQMLDGYWKGQPRKVFPDMALALHFLERENVVWLGIYQGAKPELKIPGKFSLLVGDAQRIFLSDLDLSNPRQQKLRHILKAPAAQTYSYYIPQAKPRTSDTSSTKAESTEGYYETIVKGRPFQSLFRARVMERHGARCVVTGCTALDLLDAAHIKGRHWLAGHNNGDDGIPLRVDIHRAYDIGLIDLDSTNGFRIARIDDSIQNQYREYLA